MSACLTEFSAVYLGEVFNLAIIVTLAAFESIFIGRMFSPHSDKEEWVVSCEPLPLFGNVLQTLLLCAQLDSAVVWASSKAFSLLTSSLTRVVTVCAGQRCRI